MTKASEVTVTFDEVVRFHELQEEAGTSTALAAFLAARVPGAKPRLLIGELQDTLNEGHNALRDAVLRGPG